MQGLLEAPWDDLVTNDRLDARFAEVDARFAEVDARFVRLESRMDTRFAEVNAQIEKSLRSNTHRMLTAMFAMNGALAAVIAALR